MSLWRGSRPLPVASINPNALESLNSSSECAAEFGRSAGFSLQQAGKGHLGSTFRKSGGVREFLQAEACAPRNCILIAWFGL
jgi:hypothetical protein